MNSSTQSTTIISATGLRWLARVLSVLILLFVGFFMVVSFFGDAAQPSRPLILSDFISLSALIVSLAGLALALKWELPGAAVTLSAVLVGAIINWRVLTFPLILIPVVAVLFLSCWWLSRRRQGQQRLRQSP